MVLKAYPFFNKTCVTAPSKNFLSIRHFILFANLNSLKVFIVFKM